MQHPTSERTPGNRRFARAFTRSAARLLLVAALLVPFGLVTGLTLAAVEIPDVHGERLVLGKADEYAQRMRVRRRIADPAVERAAPVREFRVGTVLVTLELTERLEERVAEGQAGFSIRTSTATRLGAVREMLTAELSRYDCLVRPLRCTIVYVDSLQQHDRTWAGESDYDAKTIILVDRGEGGDRRLRGTLHHEVAHHLHRRTPSFLGYTAWCRSLPEGFRYSLSSHAGVAEGRTGGYLDPEHLDRGFVSAYASATIGEDFAETVEAIMTDADRLWEVSEHRSRGDLRRKIREAARFLALCSNGRLSMETLFPEYEAPAVTSAFARK